MRSLIFVFVVGLLTMASAFGEGPSSFIFGRGAEDILAPTDFGLAVTNARLARSLMQASDEGFSEVSSGWGSKQYSDARFLIAEKKFDTAYTRRFLKTLEKEKGKLMYLYGLKNREYNRLALLAFGVLGRESKLSLSPKYMVKEMAPLLVTGAKFAVASAKGQKYTGTNSRGPTQIKKIPVLIEQHYGFKKSELMYAENAAVATLGFLAQCLQETKNRIAHRKLSYIDSTNIYDYLLYSYFGSARQLVEGTATPYLNIYIKTVKSYIKGLILLEAPIEQLGYRQPVGQANEQYRIQI
ncbi:MAG: hypothetical protein V4692_06025 [Bdellovibrionota bacterium]